MKIFIRSISFLLLVVSIASAEAKTIKYELTNAYVSSGSVRYEGLEFSNPSAVVLTIAKTPPSTEIKLAVEISFPKAAKLFATNFKLVDGSKYRAIVSDVWIYKEVIVEVDSIPLQPNQPVQIHVFVSERSAFNNPVADNQPNPQSTLFHLMGQARDITPTRTVDSLTSTIYNKKVILALKDRLAFDVSEGRGAFAIDATWYGKGSKTLYFPADISAYEYDDVEAIALTIQGGPPEDPVIAVTFKSIDGHERFSRFLTLQELLVRAYGPSAFN